ncbi:MAG: hypothetical protein JW927_06300 [Deltaproteobacteria bacterium]|nr:hypothetical protein [Deltaproteobacteria bacterium]
MKILFRIKNIIFPVRNILLACLALIMFTGEGVYSVESDELRVNAGLDLFPSLITADLDIAKKRGGDGTITLLLLYTDNRSQAISMSYKLGELKAIRNIPIRVEVSNDLTMSAYADNPLAGIFLTQPLDEKLSGVIRFAVNKGIILFSPFQGDVEKGALGGLYISDRVLPYINNSTMKAAGINIKQFFMRVSVIYGQ